MSMQQEIGLFRHYSSRIYNKFLGRTGWVPRSGLERDKSTHVILTAGYNGNLGDQAIAQCVARECLRCGSRPVFAEYEFVSERNNIAQKHAIMFGGEIGSTFYFRALQKQQPDPSRASIGGISIDQAFIANPDPEVLAYLRQISAFFVRDKSVAQVARDLLKLEQIKYAPDIVFSLAESSADAVDDQYSRPMNVKMPKTIGINVQAFFHMMSSKGRFTPLKLTPFASVEETARAELGYRQALRHLISQYQEKGYKVVNYSFCIQDTIYFERHFGDTKCQTLEFHWRLDKLIASIKQCSLFVASRYHAHIASMIAGVPTISIMVGAKNSGLLRDMDIETDRHQIERKLFLRGDEATAKLLSIEPFCVSKSKVYETSALARASLREILVSH